MTTNTYVQQVVFAEASHEALRHLQKAADQWCLGDPEKPSSEQILGELITIFHKYKLIQMPSGKIDTARPDWLQMLDRQRS